MAIAVTSTVSSSGASSVTLVIPAGALTNDILTLHAYTRSSATMTILDDSGATWTLKDKVGSTVTLQLFWRRAATDPSGSTVHVNGGLSASLAAMLSWSGCSTSGDPIEAISSSNNVVASSASTLSALTVPSSGAAVVFACSQSDDRAFSTATAGGTPSSLTGLTNQITSVGNDGMLATLWNLMPSSGVTGTFTYSAAAAPAGNQWLAHAFALTPAGGGEEPPPTGMKRTWRLGVFGLGA